MASGVNRTVMVLVMLSIATSNHAADETAEAPMFLFSGFGTLGVVHSDEERADFVSNVFVPRGAGYSRQWSPEIDSRLGAQLIGNFTPRLSATLQLISEQRHDGKYVPRVEWANFKYQVSPQLSVRLGRAASASFLVSDYRKVGYANPWVRPPQEVYGLVPIFSSDGVDVSYSLNSRQVVHTLLLGYGRTDHKDSVGGIYRARKLWTISDTVEFGSATLRIAYQEARVGTNTLNAVFDGFRQFGPQGSALAERYDPDGKTVSFIAIGGVYDPGNWFAMAEWGRANLNSVLGESTAWYVSGGYRIRSFTPYVTYARTKANSRTSDPGLSLTGLPPEIAGPAAGLNAALNTVLGSIAVQQSISAGVRWDLMKNLALKLQYDHKNPGVGSAGTFVNTQPGFPLGEAIGVFSVAMDFVW